MKKQTHTAMLNSPHTPQEATRMSKKELSLYLKNTSLYLERKPDQP